MNFLIAPDKFKGSLDALSVAQALEKGIRRVFPDAICRLSPLADGGDGTVDVFLSQGLGVRRSVSTRNALGEPLDASYALLQDGKTAVIEVASSIGLARLGETPRDLLHASSEGVGIMMSSALRDGATTLWVGLGGSATNDGGCGMAQALGWRFLDSQGEAFFPRPLELHRLARLVAPDATPRFECLALADVTNPLLGPNGATRIFGPQKGGPPEELEILESALTHLSEIAERQLGVRTSPLPGSGAAGGLGFGLITFCGARVTSGFEKIAEINDYEHSIAEADWVLTGEGRLDRQSRQGKGPFALAEMARAHRKPVAFFAGEIEWDGTPPFDYTDAISARVPKDQALREAAALLEEAGFRFAQRAACEAQ